MNKDDKGIVTINTGKLELIKKNGNLLLSKDAEQQLAYLLAVEKFVQDVKEYVCDTLKHAMEKENVIKVQSGEIVVTKRSYGRRFKAQNIDAVDDAFTSSVSYLSLNTSAIDEYMEKTNSLPDNVEIAERDERVTIVERKNG